MRSSHDRIPSKKTRQLPFEFGDAITLRTYREEEREAITRLDAIQGLGKSSQKNSRSELLSGMDYYVHLHSRAAENAYSFLQVNGVPVGFTTMTRVHTPDPKIPLAFAKRQLVQELQEQFIHRLLKELVRHTEFQEGTLRRYDASGRWSEGTITKTESRQFPDGRIDFRIEAEGIQPFYFGFLDDLCVKAVHAAPRVYRLELPPRSTIEHRLYVVAPKGVRIY